jgi:hypothetical protein
MEWEKRVKSIALHRIKKLQRESGILTGMMFVRETRQSGLHTTIYAIPLGTASVVLLWLFVRRPFITRHRRWLRLMLRWLIDMAVQKWCALVFVIGVHAVSRRAIFVGRPVQSLARRHVAHGWMRRIRYLFTMKLRYKAIFVQLQRARRNRSCDAQRRKFVGM